MKGDYEFNHCCDEHTKCYAACGTKKTTCDQQLKDCLWGYCSFKYQGYTNQNLEACEEAANNFWQG